MASLVRLSTDLGRKLQITVYLFLFLTFIVDRVKMIIKQNEIVDQIYHCRSRSAVCGWFNDVAGNMIVVLGPKW